MSEDGDNHADLAKELSKLRNQIDHLQQDADRAAGAFEHTMQRLKDEHECVSIDQAEKKLEGMEAKLEKAEQELEKELEEFKLRYGEELS